MQAVARLPQGALVLPGFDTDMPSAVWSDLDDAMLSEDHPQYRFHRLLADLGMDRDHVKLWHNTPPPTPRATRVISLALRPAPVTDGWLSDGPNLRRSACHQCRMSP